MRDRLVMRGKALKMDFNGFANILQRLRLSFALAVAALQRWTKNMVAADRLLFQDDSVVHRNRLRAAGVMVNASCPALGAVKTSVAILI